MLFTPYCVIFIVFLGKKILFSGLSAHNWVSIDDDLKIMRTSEFTMSVRVIAFYHGKKNSDLFEKKNQKQNYHKLSFIPKLYSLLKSKFVNDTSYLIKSGILGKTNFYQFYHIVTSNVDRLQRGAIYRLIFVMFILRDYIHCSSSTVCHHKFSWKNFLYTDLYV